MSEQRNRRLKVGGAALSVAVLAVVAGGIRTRVHSEQELVTWTAERAVPSVSITHAAPAPASDGLVLPANLQAFNSAPIYARTSGYVRQWLVDIGDRVHQGQLLAILDAPEVEQQLAQAHADLQTALANQQLASSTAARWQSLLAKDAVSKQETEERVGDLAAKSAVTNAARANVARLEALTGFTRLEAPFDGIVTSRAAEIGALINAGSAAATPLFTVADVSRIRVFVRVPQVYSAQVHPGMEVTLTLPEYPERSFPAKLTRTAGAVDPNSGTQLVELLADNPERALKPGAYAQATFPLHGASDTVTLPPSALVIGEKGTRVALLDADGKAVLHLVTLGHDRGKVVEIVAGLSKDDPVIDNPPESLETGDPVRVANDMKGNANAAQ